MQVLAEISEFDLEIDYLPRAKNYIQDVLSQRPDYKEPLTIPSRSTAIDKVDIIMLLEFMEKKKVSKNKRWFIGVTLIIRMSCRFWKAKWTNNYQCSKNIDV
jgi:hypothetical protein